MSKYLGQKTKNFARVAPFHRKGMKSCRLGAIGNIKGQETRAKFLEEQRLRDSELRLKAEENRKKIQEMDNE